jgi:hypothetical protein
MDNLSFTDAELQLICNMVKVLIDLECEETEELQLYKKITYYRKTKGNQ